MKDVKLCSISSVAFTLEVDAYDTLYNYIESIRARYSDDPDGEEIIADIEARIAELILSVHSADRVVAKPLVDNIIKQMGSVDDICADATGGDQEPTSDSTSGSVPDDDNEAKAKVNRHLYRNVDDASIGGVCSGLAAYIGCSVVVVRLIALLLLLCWGSSFWIYIVLWIALQPAVTARQKLEMRGEPVTVASIKDYYNTVANSEQNRSAVASLLAVIGRILMIFFKIFMVIILISLILAFVGVAIGLFAVVAIGATSITAVEVCVAVMALTSIAMVLVLGIYSVIQMLNSRKISWKAILVMFCIWLALTIGTAMMSLINHDDLTTRIKDLREWSFTEESLEELLEELELKYEVHHNDSITIGKDKMEQLQRLEIIYNETTGSTTATITTTSE